MAYTPINWDENTLVTAVRLDKMDTEIDSNEQRLTDIDNKSGGTVTNDLQGQIDNLESGAQAKILYSLLNGYIEGVYVYIPPETAEYMEKDEGENTSLSFRLDLGNDISINPTAGKKKTLENLEKQYEEGGDEEVQKNIQDMKQRIQDIPSITESTPGEISPVMVVHTGPGLIGVVLTSRVYFFFFLIFRFKITSTSLKFYKKNHYL